jgi:hemolysin III
MENLAQREDYPREEEVVNILSHAGGLLLSVAALVLLVVRASLHGNGWHVVSFSIFGASLVALYGASTAYHSAQKPKLRERLRVIDHAAIYILIAGTYTPFTLVTLKGAVGWVVFGVCWAMALAGVVLKLYFTGRYHRVSTAMYLFMGWVIVFAIKPLVANLSSEGLFWLVVGGLSYTVGAVFFCLGKVKFNHALFHAFVLLGSISHFIAVYFYVLPVAAAEVS